jgi:hypothetical protein
MVVRLSKKSVKNALRKDKIFFNPSEISYYYSGKCKENNGKFTKRLGQNPALD